MKIKISLQEAEIKKQGNVWKVVGKDGEVLGEHKTRAEAVEQLQAINSSCQSKKKKSKKKESVSSKQILFFDK